MINWNHKFSWQLDEYGKWFVMYNVLATGCFYWYLILWETLHFQVCLRPREGQPESWCYFCRFCFWNCWPRQFLLTLSTLRTSERLYDWLIECQQPREILYHGPGLYFPFLLKFLLTHSPRAFKPSLISFRGPRFDQSNLCALFRSHFVERRRRQQTNDVIPKVLSPSHTTFSYNATPTWPCRHTWAP